MLDNLVQLCRHHHRLVHEGGFSISRQGGGLIFRRPDGRVLEAAPSLPAGSREGCLRTSRRSGARVDEHSCNPRSAGEAMDLDLAVFALCAMQERREGLAAAPG